jgi:hypothetical protein
MSINDITLSASDLASLYPASLVETTEVRTKTNKPAPAGKSLGGNKKNILVVVKYAEDVYLPDNALQLLINMLGACKLGIEDVAIVNISKQPLEYKELLDTYRSRIAILFDVEPSAFGLPMSFPFYQIQPFAGCSFLYSPSLDTLENNKDEKTKLWTALKRLFNI